MLLERFARPGPMAGVVAKVDLRDPRVGVKVVLADPPPAGGKGAATDCAGRLEVPSAVARRQDFAVAVNASFFRAAPRQVGGQPVPYFVGNCGMPVGWHFSEGQLRARPASDRLRATVVVHASGRVTLHPGLAALPPDTRSAVSGNAMVLEAGKIPPAEGQELRHPRTAVGLSADGNTLFLVAVDGRQEGHSQGATLAELGTLLKALGAHDAVNLDGGGSTAMVVKDSSTGVFSVVNRPSELASGLPGVRLERPVVDVLGVSLAPEAPVK